MGKDKTLNQQIATGAIWMVAARFAVKGIGLVSIMILARILVPDDFGIIALASSIYAMIELMRSMGFDTVLIQKQQAGREQYDTAWTLQIIFSSFAACVMLLIAPLMASFYDDQRLIQVLWVMAGMTFLNGLTNIGVVEFRKQMNFNKDFAFQVLVKLSGFLVTIPLAFYWRSYWAMLMGMLSTRIVTVVLSYYMQSYRPRLSLSKTREILSFSSWLFINNILFFMNGNSQNFIVGKLLGNESLGLLSISTQISNLATDELVAPVNRAAFPGYAKLADNIPLFKETYLKILAHIALISVSAAFAIATLAPILVPVMLGDKWLNAVPLIQLMALISAFISLNTNSGYVYMALGKPEISTKLILFRILLLIPLLIYLSKHYGVIGVAYALLIVVMIMWPISQFVVTRLLEIKLFELLSTIYRPIISGALVYCILHVYGLYQQLVDCCGINVLGLFIQVSIVLILQIFVIFCLNLIVKDKNSAELLLLKKGIGRLNKRYK